MKTGIINKIERLRKEKRLTKKKLCEYSNISTNMYSKYLNGSKIPFETACNMIEYMDCKLIIISKYEEV